MRLPGPRAARSRPRPDAEIDAALKKLGVSPRPTTRPFVVTLNTPATYFLTAAALWVFAPIQEKWITTKGATEAAQLRRSGPFLLTSGSTTARSSSSRTRTGTATKPLLTEIDMSMTTEPAQAQAAYEAGELDMVLPPTEDIQRVKADPALGPQVVAGPAFGITYYDFNNAKTRPDRQQGLPDRADPGHRQEGLHRRDLRRRRQARQQHRDAGHPGLPTRSLDPYPVDLAPPRSTWRRPSRPSAVVRRGTSAS